MENRLDNNAKEKIHLNLETPILFLVFNRIETTKKVFNKIRESKPKRLYIAADGPRKDIPEEKFVTEKVRNYLLQNIDWQCELRTLFRTENLGCKKAISSAIDWFFENEDEGIILEDDCLPNESFFQYCSVLLERYRESKEVGIITGSNYFFEEHNLVEEDYYFSHFPFIWGWATWKRVWENYDVKLEKYQQGKFHKLLKQIMLTEGAIQYWSKCVYRTKLSLIDSWDYQLAFMIFEKKLLNIVPSKNLISNIGFNDMATHTSGNTDNPHSNMPNYKLELPLKHPQKIKRNEILDLKFEKLAFKQNIIYNLFSSIRFKFLNR